MSARDCAYVIGKLSQATQLWQASEANALAIPKLVGVLNEQDAAGG